MRPTSLLRTRIKSYVHVQPQAGKIKAQKKVHEVGRAGSAEMDGQRWTAGEEQGGTCGKSKSVLGLVLFSVIVICWCDRTPGEEGK